MLRLALAPSGLRYRGQSHEAREEKRYRQIARRSARRPPMDLDTARRVNILECLADDHPEVRKWEDGLAVHRPKC